MPDIHRLFERDDTPDPLHVGEREIGIFQHNNKTLHYVDHPGNVRTIGSYSGPGGDGLHFGENFDYDNLGFALITTGDPFLRGMYFEADQGGIVFLVDEDAEFGQFEVKAPYFHIGTNGDGAGVDIRLLQSGETFFNAGGGASWSFDQMALLAYHGISLDSETVFGITAQDQLLEDAETFIMHSKGVTSGTGFFPLGGTFGAGWGILIQAEGDGKLGLIAPDETDGQILISSGHLLDLESDQAMHLRSYSGQIHLQADTVLNMDGDSLDVGLSTTSQIICGGEFLIQAATDVQLASGSTAFVVEPAGIRAVNLPTSNPGGSNKIWNDGGTLKIT